MNFLFLVILTLLLFIIIVIDTKTKRIPDALNISMLILGIISFLVFPELKIESRLWGMFIVSIPMLICASIIPNSFGGGDIKLVAAAGFLLGVKGIFVAMVIAFFIGGIFALFLIVLKRVKSDSTFAFGPFIAIGILISSFYGNELAALYFQL